VSWRYIKDILEIFDGFPGDISLVSLIYLMSFLEIYVGILGDI